MLVVLLLLLLVPNQQQPRGGGSASRASSFGCGYSGSTKQLLRFTRAREIRRWMLAHAPHRRRHCHSGCRANQSSDICSPWCGRSAVLLVSAIFVRFRKRDESSQDMTLNV